MSPASRPAYVETFGKETTEAAEAKARDIIAEKKAARERTKYAEHAHEADNLEGVPAQSKCNAQGWALFSILG